MHLAAQSNGLYASQIVLVQKYRLLNDMTVLDTNPMHKLENFLNKLGKADLTKRFRQIPFIKHVKGKSAVNLKAVYCYTIWKGQFECYNFGTISL